jgi:protease I
MDELNGRRVAILVTDGFEQMELTEPRKALQAAGAATALVSPKKEPVQGYHHDEKADLFQVDIPLSEADAHNFDALVLPGGVANPDALRIDDQAIDFIRTFYDDGKPIAAICHGPWTLIEVGAAAGRRMTSWPSLRTDLENAGAEWVDEQVVVDHGLVTSRKPDDLPAFCRKMVEEFAEGNHGPRLQENAREPREASLPNTRGAAELS